ncbi:flagellar hook-associated protein FlgL [soil metagenome]
MRISTANSYNASIETLTNRQQDLYEAQNQLTTGYRVNKASDDPAAAARSERALASIARTEATKRAVDASQTAMSQTEGALSDAGDLLQQAREALVAAGNATYTDAERADQAKQLRQIRTQLLSVANRADASGNYMFGGQGATSAPFVDAPGGVQWRSVAGEVKVSADESLPTSIDGQGAWMQARTGNGVFVTQSASTNAGGAWIDSGTVSNAQALTGSSYQVQFSVNAGVTTYSVMKDGVATAASNQPYTSGQQIQVDGMSFAVTGVPANGDSFGTVPSTPTLSVFDVLDKAAAALEIPLRSSGQIAQTNNESIRDLDAVMGKLQSTRSAVGDTLNRIESASGRLSDAKLAAETENANAIGLDEVKAISDYKTKESSFDAALKSYAMVQRLSLFNYVNG